MRECAAATSRGFAAAAEKLLNTLGYHSERKAAVSRSVADFMREYPAADTQSAKQFRAAVADVNIIFQFAESEVQEGIERGLLPPSTQFKKGDKNSFLFVAADLQPGHYSRSNYADFVREINKRFNAPTVALFRRPVFCDPVSGDKPDALTLAFIGRRPSKTRHGRDVLEKVSLLREIQCDSPHRGHLDILAELSLAQRLEWINDNNKSKDFDGLLAAWLDELDSEALNHRFYCDLREWFSWACAKAVFPCVPGVSRDRAVADSVIRLITRMMFIWFIKEKELVADQLFSESQISPLLANYNAVKGDTYYRAILQNLFFATLNTKIKERRFSCCNNDDHRNPNLFRYENLMRDSKAIVKLMKKTPFINGGLFDCLDDFEGVLAGGKRIDCFTDNPSQRKDLRVPNILFFSKEKKKLGLLTIFKRYKFTVEENTPVEQEVALDPELLGKVFENLLAEEINPETRQPDRKRTKHTDRKRTGSFYTPRVIVDYMADESLVAYLAAKVPSSGDRQWRQKLHDLFDYAISGCENIAKNKIASLVGAIADIKVLDPACGSGAFPMGVLNKLALALSKLDSENKEWKKLQEERATAAAGDAFASGQSQAQRESRLEEINDTFTKYSEPFGRKLFLIQNSIFGADIQPVACQIAKLRFFISLAIEQKKDESAKNFGIRPLPNLETRFVAADTLIGIGGATPQRAFGDKSIAKLQKQLAENREQYFNAGDRNAKKKCRKIDKRLRGLLAAELERTGFAFDAAEKVAKWDPYDQNAIADWFAPKWMFGVDRGFDIVIGNPPYVTYGLKKQHKEQSAAFARKFPSVRNTANLFAFFIEHSISLLAEAGTLAFIVPHSVSRVDGYKYIREYIHVNAPLWEIVDQCSQFEKVTLEMVSLFCGKDAKPEFIKSLSNRNQEERVLPCDIYKRTGYYPIYYDELYKKISSHLAGKIGGRRGCNSNGVHPGDGPLFIGGKNAQKYYVELGHRAFNMAPHAEIIKKLNRKEIIITQFGASLRGTVIDTEKFIPSGGCVIIEHEQQLMPMFVLALINSRLVGYFFDRYIVNHAKLTVHLDGHYLRKIPVPVATKTEQRPFVALAEKITAAKAANPTADTREMEAEIDEMVYALYDLPPDEIAIIESSVR